MHDVLDNMELLSTSVRQPKVMERGCIVFGVSYSVMTNNLKRIFFMARTGGFVFCYIVCVSWGEH